MPFSRAVNAGVDRGGPGPIGRHRGHPGPISTSRRGATIAALALCLAGATLPASASAASASPAAPEAAAAAASVRQGVTAATARRSLPALRVRTVVTDLDHPWDIAFLPSAAMLYTERERGRIWWRGHGGTRHLVVDRPADLWVSGETGLMSIAVDDAFARTRTFWTCQGANTVGGGHDVRVVRWRLADDARSARRLGAIVTGLPATSGRHGGCRLEFGSEGALYVGTGDAATASTPQDKRSGGGKVLRVVPATGAGWPTNPFIASADAMERRVFTYGHRNVQGLALRPDGRMWSAEHGPDRDDEVNLLRSGGNYGWDPDGPGYDESVPMTDFSLPGRQLPARWSSGYPTLAVSGATWLTGDRWGGYRGRLVVAALKNSSVRMMRFVGSDFRNAVDPAALDGTFGRLRTAVVGPRNALYLSTDNGNGTDRILKVTPR